MATALLQRNEKVIVLDYVCAQWPAGVAMTRRADLAIAFMRDNPGCHAFIDETALVTDRYNPEHNFFSATSRNYGGNVTFIGQRPTMLPPTVRANTDRLYMFTLAGPDIEILAQEFARPELLTLPRLDRMRFVVVDRFGDSPLAIQELELEDDET